ncbi:MAG TPA: hypothetical protein VHG69_02885 [Thermoleophilaceae bacterium]|nr:hypothetical protein [Thermoleophilaceae bacterium]
MLRLMPLALLIAAALLAAPAAAQPGSEARWLLTGASSVTTNYWQGLTADPARRRVFFTGPQEGLWRTTPRLRQTAGRPLVIPAGVKSAEGYNHIGDPTWDNAEGGRVLLPLECFAPLQQDTNPCDTGSFGVADPATLRWRYYVKLYPAEIPKAMWAEVSPDGSRVWTSSGSDLLAYSAADVSSANAAPGAGPIRAVARLPGAVPPSGITGAVFRGGRLLLAGDDAGSFQVWSVDPVTGARRLEIQRRICGESEGLHVMRTLGGELHWLVAPFAQGCRLTFGSQSALLHFSRQSGAHALRVFARTPPGRPLRSAQAGRRVRVGVVVKGLRGRRGIPGVRVSFAGYSARTNRRGRAIISGRFHGPGRYKVLAHKGNRFGLSRFLFVSGP